MNNIFDKYLIKVDLIDYYITKNICSLIEKEESYNIIINNPILLSVVNKLNKNSLMILLENKKYEIIKNLIATNNNLLGFKNYNENTLFNILLQHNILYDYINEIILTFNSCIVIELLTSKNKDDETFQNLIIKLLNECVNYNVIEYKKIIEIFKSIIKLNNENKILLITIICREIKKNEMTFDILNRIIPLDFETIYSDEYLLNAIDYLLIKNDINSIELILNRTKKIKFCNFENLFLFNYVENNDFDEKITNILLLLIEKSNINKFKNKNNENLLEILINNNKIEIDKLKKYFELFGMKNNIKKIKNNKILNLKEILMKAELNIFLSSPIYNMLYLLHILKKYDNVIIPYNIKSQEEIINDNLLLNLSDIDYFLSSYLKIYKNDYNSFTPHLIIWKNKWNYYIDNNLIDFLKTNINKRYVLIKLSIVLLENSDTRHANYLIVDNKKKIIERFEPYGEIEIGNSLELNKMIDNNICKKINYQFCFSQLYPGFQIKSDELNIYNKNIGDPSGYCLAWCYMYIEVKLIYENSDTANIINNYIINKFSKDFNEIDSSMNKYIYFIRYYSKYLDSNKNKLLKSFGIKNYYKKEFKPNEEKNIITNINKHLLKCILK
jgi:hypothetical protein